MEAQERHSPDPILEETFLPQPSDLQLGSHHHSHLDSDDTSPSSLLHELTPEQTDLLKVQLQLHSYQQQRLHLHHHQHQHPFSLDDEDDDDHSRSPLEHHHHHHNNVLQIHPNDAGISDQDLTPTPGLHHLDFDHQVEFADDQGLQIHSHQPIYEDPTGGPYHLSQPFDLSSSSLSFEHTDLSDNTHSHHHHQLYSSHPDHHLSVQPVASSSTSSTEDAQSSEPTKRKAGRPSRKKPGVVSIDRALSGSSEGSGMVEAVGNGMGSGVGSGVGASAKNTKPIGGSTGPGPTKRLRTVASLGDDMEKIEKLRAQGRERQRRKRERDRARAAGISIEPESLASKSIPGPSLDLSHNLEPNHKQPIYHHVQSAPRSSPLSDTTSNSLLTSQHRQMTRETGLPSTDPPPIFRLDDLHDQLHTTNGQSGLHTHTNQLSQSASSHTPLTLESRARASTQAHADKSLSDQGIFQRLDDLSRSGIQALEEHLSAGNGQVDLVDIQLCLERAHTQRTEVGEQNEAAERLVKPSVPAHESIVFDTNGHASVRENLALANGKALNRVSSTEVDDTEGKGQGRADDRSGQSSEIDPALTLDEWEIPIDLGLERHLSSSPSQSDSLSNRGMHSHSDASRNRNGNENGTNAYHSSFRIRGTIASEDQDVLHADGLSTQDGEHSEGLLDMTPSLSIPLLPYFCSG